jgi:cyclase
MFKPRVIPLLLIQNGKLVKTLQFKKPVYIGDPINAIKIFNELKAEEIMVMDISASPTGKTISIDLVKELGEEADMPFSAGGGIQTLFQAEQLIKAGAEKIVLNSWGITNPALVREMSDEFGASTISVCIDYKKNIWGKKEVRVLCGEKGTKLTPVEAAKKMEDAGTGEIILQSIDHDGTMNGYDIETLKEVSENTHVPLVALGGAASTLDMQLAYQQGFVTGMAAGSLFVFKGSQRGVLINYPEAKNRNFTR